MTRWPRVRLGDVLRHAPRPVDVDPSAEYREIGIRSHGHGLFHKGVVLGAGLGSKKVFWLEPGDFILSIVFAWEGAVGIVGDAEAGMIGSHRFPTFRADEERLNSHFLLNYFRTKEGIEWLLRVSPGGAGRNRTLSRSAFLNLEVPLPPLIKQRSVVSRIEEVIDATERADLLRSEVERELGGLLMGAYRRITEGAPRRPLGEVAPLTRRPVVVDPTTSYPQIAVRSFGRGTFNKPPLEGCDVTWEKPFLVHGGDLLISNIKAWEGAIAVVSKTDHGRFGSHRYLTCVADPSLASARYICFHLLTREGLHHVGEASPGSADRNRTLGAGALQAIPVPVPSLNRQQWFARVFDEVDHARRLQQQAIEKQKQLLPSVVQYLFGGGIGLPRREEAARVAS